MENQKRHQLGDADPDILRLHTEGSSSSEITEYILANYENPFKLSRDQIRKNVRSTLRRNFKPSLTELSTARPDVHEALIEECKAAGLDPNKVNYFWYKNENFSINASGAREEDRVNQVEAFKVEVNHLREQLMGDTSKWLNFYQSIDQLQDNRKTPDALVQNGKLFVPSIFDLHIGKLAWSEESGEDYNSDIAVSRFRAAIDDLIYKTKSFDITRILFPVGNDLFNSDGFKPFTATTSGTPQHDDSKWQQMFRTGKELICEAIMKLSVIAPVDVVTVFSNHDHQKVYFLGEVLSATFAGNPRVTVDNSPNVRKYYKFGKCLIGLAHGHNESADRLPLLMAQEQPEHWSNTTYREWLLGHLHHRKKSSTQNSKDYNGVVVTYLSSLSAPDAWHHEKAFKGAIKGADGFVYDEFEGLVATVLHNIY